MKRVRLCVAAAVLPLIGMTIAGGDVYADQTTFPASEQPRANTARVLDGHIFGITSNGGTVVVAGDFTTVRDFTAGSAEQTRNYLFAYNHSDGVVSQTFAPQVDGFVQAVEFVNNGTQVLIAGNFRAVNGIARRGIARLNVSDGSVDTSFTGVTSGAVLDMAVTEREIIVGGYFDSAGGLKRPRLAALDKTTGKAIPGFAFAFAGVLNPDFQSQITQVRELDVSEDGRWLITLGNFTTVNGLPRQQVALFNLDTYTLADWYVPQLAGWPCNRGRNNVSWVNTVEISSDSKYAVTGAQGAFHANTLCDTVARFELPPTSAGAVEPTWISYTGGDSIFRVEATAAAVYAGGHTRWSNNGTPSTSTGQLAGDRDGPGSVYRYGIAALDPATGVPLTWNPNRDGARPPRGFEAMVPYGDLLFLGSDGTRIGGETRQRVAAYTVANGIPNPLPEQVSLPVDLSYVTDNVVRRTRFDGLTFSTPSTVSGPAVDGVDWSNTKDGFVQRGSLTSFNSDGSYGRRAFGLSVGTVTNLSQTVGYVDDGALTPWDQPYGVDKVRAAAYVGGRIIYTRSDSSLLFWRWYSTQSGIIGSQQYTLDSSQDWRDSNALEVIGNQLYAADRRLGLVRYDLQSTPSSVSVRPGSRALVDAGVSGVDWSTVRGLFATPAS